MSNNKLIDDMIQLSSSKYKFETFTEEEGIGYFINGFIELIDPIDGFIWETYEIKILVSNNYPKVIPKTYLISKNIPFEYERHIGRHGACCMSPTVEEYLILGRNYNLIDYIEKIVIPFFAAQKLYDLEGKWPNDEYSHFGDGLFEYYSEKLNLHNKAKVIQAIEIILRNIKVGRNEKCFCGSDLKYKKCHLSIIEKFGSIPRGIFMNDLKVLSEL